MKTNRTINPKLSLFVCTAVLLGSLSGAEAFCVQNDTDKTINAQQTTNYKMFRGFTEDVTPGNKRCCSWQNDTCNKAGKQDSPTSFSISYIANTAPPMPGGGGGTSTSVTICNTYSIPANGTLAVTGKNGSYRCETRP